MTEIPRDSSGRVLRPKPSQLLADVMEKLGPDHLTTRTLMAALIERDQGAGVEPRAVSPTFGIHLPVLSDPPNVPYDMQENTLDVETALTEARPNVWCNGSYPSTPASGTTVNVTNSTLVRQYPGGGLGFSAGAVQVTRTGVYRVSMSATINWAGDSYQMGGARTVGLTAPNTVKPGLMWITGQRMVLLAMFNAAASSALAAEWGSLPTPLSITTELTVEYLGA
jgi:hypothetical protein